MTGKISSEYSLEEIISQTLDSHDERILEKVPNLDPQDCPLLVYLVAGYHLGKRTYFGLTFPMEDSTNIHELKALSNGYFEIRNGVGRMGVLKLENLEKIMSAPYLKPGSTHIAEDVW